MHKPGTSPLVDKGYTSLINSWFRDVTVTEVCQEKISLKEPCSSIFSMFFSWKNSSQKNNLHLPPLRMVQAYSANGKLARMVFFFGIVP